MLREDVEQAIEDEERTLTQAAGLLRSRAPWDHWPLSVRRALELALDEPPTSETSAQQARVLRRHLFGPDTWSSPFSAPDQPTWIEIRRSERLRADLPRLVSLRAGAYLATRQPSP
ncbi:MAG: hypothetical protein ACLQBX_17960 [Candidatus Limnocylindrales bacterium]|jgi:hypothetical protein